MAGTYLNHLESQLTTHSSIGTDSVPAIIPEQNASGSCAATGSLTRFSDKQATLVTTRPTTSGQHQDKFRNEWFISCQRSNDEQFKKKRNDNNNSKKWKKQKMACLAAQPRTAVCWPLWRFLRRTCLRMIAILS